MPDPRGNAAPEAGAELDVDEDGRDEPLSRPRPRGANSTVLRIRNDGETRTEIPSLYNKISQHTASKGSPNIIECEEQYCLYDVSAQSCKLATYDE